jgi:glycosyltransferase involved in cell wall biosynthesis
MRLGIEVTTCTPLRTGVGYYTEHLVDALLETRGPGDDVVLLSNRKPAPELASRWLAHLHVSGPGVRALWMQSEVPRMLTETRADVGLFPNYTMPLASPCPTIVVVHDLAILRMPQHFTLRKRILLQPMLRQSVAAASVIATVSEAARSDIIRLLGVPADRIAVFPCAAHPSCSPATAEVVAAARQRHGLHRPYILTVGTLEPRKNLLTLLRAFDRLGPAMGDHDLVVVGGRGWQDRQLVRALKERAAGRRVRWLGYVAESDLVALYTGADVFVLASALEGFGLPVLEAMACGTPVIASDISALREVGGDVPHFVPPNDDASLARAIEQSLGDRGGAAEKRAAGLARAQQFSWTRTAEALWARARQTGPTRLRGARANGAAIRPAAATPLPPPLPPPPHGFDAREWALLATVVYADLFDSPLPVTQALTASIGFAFDERELRRLVQGAALAPLVTLHPGGYLVLTERSHLVDSMPEREALTRELLERNRKSLSFLAVMPFVRSLMISGGVAHKNPGRRPDVDLFIVAAPRRAYTAYTMMFLATKLTGRRHVVCPNYLLDETELAIAYHRDLFTAHQLASSLPFSGQRTYEALCRANETWVRRFFPTFAPRPALDRPPSAGLQWPAELALWLAAPALERLARTAWRLRLRRRAAAAPRSDVVLANGILKLHLSDYRRAVMDRFAERLLALRERIDSGTAQSRVPLEPVGA